MKESDYYPAGAYNDPNAPYNQSDQDPIEFDLTVCESLSRTAKVHTDDYVLEGSYLDPEDGGYIEEVITDDTDWYQAFTEEHYDIKGLLNVLKETCQTQIENIDLEIDQYKTDSRKYHSLKNKRNYYQFLIEECDSWEEDDSTIIKN